MTEETTTEPPASLIGGVQPTPTDPGAEPLEAEQQGAPESAPAAEPEAAPEPLSASDLTLPEGAEVDEAAMASFLEFSTAQNFTKEQAQGALDLYAQQITQLGETFHKQWETTQAEWQEQCRALPDIGGDKLDASLAEVAKVVDKYGSQDLRTALDVTGAGNHPAVVQFLHRIAKVVNEAPPVSGQPTATASLSRADRMFKGA